MGLNFSEILKPAYDMVTMDQPGALVTVSAPTGSGKTFGIINYLCKRVVENRKFRAYFVATKKNNLHPEMFGKRLLAEYVKENGNFESTEARRQYLHRTLAVLRSLEETIAIVLNHQNDIPVSLQSDGLSRVVERLETYYQRFRNQPDQVLRGERIKDYQNMAQAFTEFKGALIERVAAELGLNMPLNQGDRVCFCNYVAADKTPAAHYLNQYFPEINLDQHQLVLLTWAKFTRSYQSFFSSKSITISRDEELGDSLIVLDEIDEMKRILSDQIIDDSLRLPIDFLALFREIHAATNNLQKSRPADIMAILRQKQRFSKLKQRVDYLDQKYKLTEDYKTINSATKTNFIFNLSSLTITSSHAWWSRDNPEEKKVVLTQLKPQTDDLHFYEMVRQIGLFLETFTELMGKWAELYQSQVNGQRDDLENQLQLESALRTVCDTLWLSQDAKNIIVAMFQRLGGYRRKAYELKFENYYGRHLQRYGLQLVSLTDSDDHLNRTQVEIGTVQTTPEKFLLRLVKRGVVLGMSATVNVETVLSNFDFNFLREPLGERLLDGLENLPDAVKESFDVSRRYRENGGTVKVLETTSQAATSEGGHCMRDLVQTRLQELKLTPEQDENLKKLDQFVKQTMIQVHQHFQRKDNPKEYQYIQLRYLELFDSFICFLGNEKLPTFLGLQSVLPKEDDDFRHLVMDREFIEQVWEKLVAILCSAERSRPQLRMIAKKLSSQHLAVENQVAKALDLPAVKETRVYLLSSYATLGVGQNLQYRVGTLERSQVIDIAPKAVVEGDERRQMVDIAGIYLGRVTQIFTQIPDQAKLSNRKEWITGYYELAGLVDNGEINLAQVAKYARKQSNGQPVRQFRETISYVGAHTRVVLQAVGRLDRAFNKVPETMVLLGSKVIDYFNVTMMQDYQLGPVAQAIRNHQLQKKHVVLTSAHIRRIRFRNQTQETQDAVLQMVGQLQISADAAGHFQTFRETLLKYPTMTAHQYDSRQNRAEFSYLDMQSVSYRAQREGDEFTFPSDGQGNVEISAEAAGLTIIAKNPDLRKIFEANQWPLFWTVLDYILNPVQFDSYRGILGEECGKFLIEKYWSTQLAGLTHSNYELFDFQTANHVLIDIKNWRQPHQREVIAERQHVMDKLDEISRRTGQSDWRVLMVNLIAPAGSQNFIQQELVNGRVMEAPFLLDRDGKFALTMAEQRKVGEFLNGR
ncbi:hypothetical protein [Levilactobacillus parabrevis]|uniref:hypothetical protein n=1 Tax=Levilactobacillus parabrevis TaxID=357278 RepID=UPI003757F215